MTGVRLKILLFGRPVLLAGEREIPMRRQKSMALPVYLAIEARRHNREKLVSMLWPDKDTRHALGSLRSTIHDIGRIADILEVDRESVRFRHKRFEVDELEFEQLASKARTADAQRAEHDTRDHHESAPLPADMDRAVEIYRDGFLRGVALKDAPDTGHSLSNTLPKIDSIP